LRKRQRDFLFRLVVSVIAQKILKKYLRGRLALLFPRMIMIVDIETITIYYLTSYYLFIRTTNCRCCYYLKILDLFKKMEIHEKIEQDTELHKK
jgi:hypothetical protein